MKDQTQENAFQVSNMVYKIKNIKRKKKVNNIKNIELFETLSNIRTIEEPKKTIVEGYSGLTDDDWEGGDEVRSEKGLFGSSGQGVADFITKIYTAIIIANCYVAFKVSNSCASEDKKVKQRIDWKFMKKIVSSNAGKTEAYKAPMSGDEFGINQEIIDDANRVYQYLCYLESLIFAYLYTFGWYYVMFYNYYKKQINLEMNNDLTKDSIERYKDVCSPIKVKEKVQKESSGGILGAAMGAAGAGDAMSAVTGATELDVENMAGLASGIPSAEAALGAVGEGGPMAALGAIGKQNPMAALKSMKGGGGEENPKKTFAQQMKEKIMGEPIEKCIEPSMFDNITSEGLREGKDAISAFLCFIFEYALLIFESFRWLLEELIPKGHYIVKSIVQPSLCYVFVFFILFLFNQNALSMLKNLMIDIINVNYENLFLLLLVIVVMYNYINSYVNMPKWRLTALFGRLSMAMFPLNIAYAIYLPIVELIRLAIMFIVAVPLGATLCVFYVLWVSIVRNIIKFFKPEVRSGIINYIRDFHKTTKEKENEERDGPVFKASNYFAYVGLFAYNYLLYIILLFYCIHVLMSHMGNIHGNLLQQVVQYFHLGLLAIVFALFYYLYNYYKQNGSPSFFASAISPPLIAYTTTLVIGNFILYTILFIAICIIIYALFFFITNAVEIADETENAIAARLKKLFKNKKESTDIKKPDITNNNAETDWNKNKGGASNNWNTVMGDDNSSSDAINGSASASWQKK